MLEPFSSIMIASKVKFKLINLRQSSSCSAPPGPSVEGVPGSALGLVTYWKDSTQLRRAAMLTVVVYYSKRVQINISKGEGT